MSLESISTIIFSSSSGHLYYLNNTLKYQIFCPVVKFLSTINFSLNHQQCVERLTSPSSLHSIATVVAAVPLAWPSSLFSL